MKKGSRLCGRTPSPWKVLVIDHAAPARQGVIPRRHSLRNDNGSQCSSTGSLTALGRDMHPVEDRAGSPRLVPSAWASPMAMAGRSPGQV